MSDFRPFTKAELEQRERDQQDPKWLEWLKPESMKAQIDAFLNDTIPDMPGNPWTAQGLDRAERYILENFSDVDAVDLPENRAVSDQLSRFIGEVFRRNFEGAWFNVPSMGGARYPDFGPVIRQEWTDIYLDTGNLITALVDRQWGDCLSESFSNSREAYQKWVDAGRPPLAEWLKD